MPSKKTDFQKAVEWFHSLSREEAVEVCKMVNPKTPHSIIDKDLTSFWRDREKELTQFQATKEKGV